MLYLFALVLSQITVVTHHHLHPLIIAIWLIQLHHL